MSEYDFEAEELALGKPSLDELISALRHEAASTDRVVSSTIIYGLSDLSSDERQAVAAVWRGLSSSFKHQILRALNEASEAMFELNFREIAALGLRDDSDIVRAMAIELLWPDESPATMRQLMRLATNDPAPAVRSSALKALSRFILLGEYGRIPNDLACEAQRLTRALHSDDSQPLDVRRRALEALANSSHPSVEALIRQAYAHGNHDLKTSAIFAMGRTCNEIWQDILLEELGSRDNEYIYEAIMACGQIQLKEGVQRIGELTLSDDREIQLAAIWALGEIGGKQAFNILSGLSETVENDEEGAAAIETALDAASFSLSFAALDLDFDDY